ncbi:ParA family protein [Micromonospora aurantiaca (nom. illeg.)]|uniref:ParA family protein n=1 Tax=Micromonospora aurantiaca (nom. illeg.) TaxID=47850 RepID=UPI0033DAC508
MQLKSREAGAEDFWATAARRAEELRLALERCIVFVNGKGGTGKTSCCANIGATMASYLAGEGSTRRVLLLDFDIQANLMSDFGVRGQEGDDQGKSILRAIVANNELSVLQGIRPQLDIVPSGDELKRTVRYLAACTDQERVEAWLNLMEAVAWIAPAYEWILIDCPPGDEELQKLAMALARWVVIPTVFDKASRYGLEQVGKLFDLVEAVNTEAEVLGLIMFGFERREERAVKQGGEVVDYKEVGQRSRLRSALEADLARGGSDAPVFQAVIGNSRTAGEVCRELGMTAGEVADLVVSDEWAELSKDLARRLGGNVTLAPTTAEALASDYERVTGEVFQRALAMVGGRA